MYYECVAGDVYQGTCTKDGVPRVQGGSAGLGRGGGLALGAGIADGASSWYRICLGWEYGGLVWMWWVCALFMGSCGMDVVSTSHLFKLKVNNMSLFVHGVFRVPK